MEFFGVLSLGTLGFVVAIAYINMRQTERQLEDARKARKEAQAAPVLATK